MRALSTVMLASSLILSAAAASTDQPDGIAVRGEVIQVTVHAEGAQVYECKADAAGKRAWAFREPIATLTVDGKTVGRHYAGPNWEWLDGSTIAGKVTGRAPGASAQDIPLLRLEVTARRGSGMLSGVTTIQRVNTRGGTAAGPCETAGALKSVAYAADYVFHRKARAALAPAN